ncbi:substrate-binding periplasmic protein [Olsenella profusa]|uniref:Transporter substrate-binding domain-containing protein n=1 Tax=Olsenella profusa TaxID=138595 RepID=A0ABS2F206_9ACTN|nr:transporter substrate-binding domain-containing protein [Olsenella profusa]MBM6774980.1 transporter substrate-binding domain-containing protein [Olsenella profusa]
MPTSIRSRIRAIATTFVALLAAAGIAGCSAGPVNLDDFLASTSVADARAARRDALSPVVSADALRQAETLTVGVLATETAPLAFTAADGTQSGIDVDTAHALADALGLPSVSFVTVADVATGLEQSCDVVMGVDADDAGGSTVVGSYAQSATALFTRQDVTAPIDASALTGATVGMQDGSVSQSMLEGYAVDVAESTYPNLNEAFDALNAGEVDYVVCDALSGAYLATAYPGTVFAGTLDEPVSLGVAVSNDALASAVEGALSSIQSNGVGDLVRSRWLGAMPALTPESRVTGLVERTEDAPADAPADASADGADDAAADAPADDAAADAPADDADATPAE